MTENEIGTIVVRKSIEIHKELGPGLLESIYETILERELIEHGFDVVRQQPVSIHYKNRQFDNGFLADLLIEGQVIIELKSVEKINNAHKKQLLSYLRITNLKLGYLLNFGQSLMKDGIFRAANNLY